MRELTITAVTNVIAACEQGWLETFKWEKTVRRFHKVCWAIVVALVLASGINLATGNYVGLALLGGAGLLHHQFTMRKNREHLDWILDMREHWQTKLLHWRAVELEYAETSVLPTWAFSEPA